MINIVLFEPEIPQNTANIMRTCVATNTKLHIIHPCGFKLDINHPDIKRSSANFSSKLKFYEYENFEDFLSKNNHPQINILTRWGTKKYSEVKYDQEDIYVMFGKESTGIPKEILQQYETFRIPMTEEMRSLNLSNCAMLITYSLLEQKDFSDLK